jgi:NAD(P)-dependent dehydrogenase (short-subunit alcohol dehydrogenase family)
VTLGELALLAKTDIDPCAEEFRKQSGKLNVIVNNAAVSKT